MSIIKQIPNKYVKLTCFQYFLSYLWQYLMSFNDFDIENIYVKEVYIKSACIIKNTYVKGIIIRNAYIKSIFINDISVIKY